MSPSASTEMCRSWQQVFDMKRYFISQLKRGLRLVPGLAVVAVVLFACLGLVFSAIIDGAEAQQQTRYKIGMAGTVGDTYLELGLAALQMMDATRYSMEIVTMEEADAATALAKGDISAYVVIPEGFMDAAMSGRLLPIKFVSEANTASFTTFIKDEITAIVEDIVLSSQKGAFGIGNALVSSGNSHLTGKHANDSSIAYVEYVLYRGNTYKVSTLGISSALTLPQSLMCGLSVLLFLLCSLPLAPFLIKKDLSLEQVLWAKGCTPTQQILQEAAVYFLFLLIPGTLLLLTLGQMNLLAPGAFFTALPAFFTLSGMMFFLFQLSRDYISGMLLPFFASISLAFVSGCIYPVFFFPVALQKISAFLPTGLARNQLSACLTGKSDWEAAVLLLLYGIVFLLLSILLRRKKLTGGTQ